MGKTKTGKNHIPFRLNVLFFAVFVLFSLLILRLGYIQIVQGDEFESDLEESTSETARIDAPRGLMYDRNGELLVDNELALSLTYTNKQSVTTEERLDIARRLSELVTIETDEDSDLDDEINRRTKQDFWIATHPEDAEDLITQEDRDEVEEDELYELQLNRISDEQLSDVDDELEVVYIWGEMMSGYYDSPQRIKKNISRDEAHSISERLDNLPGVDILRDANRQYIYDDEFPDYFGSINSIPRENLDEYIAKGYARSDEVGTSFLEEEYEAELRGKKGEISSNEANNGQEETNGSRGNDLILSIDMALQQEVDAIINEEIGGDTGSFINDANAYVVMMEPDTGEILAADGYTDQLGVTSRSYEMGSTVKAATVMLGLETGAVDEYTVINDRPLDLPSTPEISSVSNLGPVNYRSALAESSNIYMSYVAMNMAGYQPGITQGWNSTQYIQAYNTFRYYYEQFGLGTTTGVDLPSESTGIDGGIGRPGSLLYLSFGQFDTYTPMQLAQYASTIANDGYRLKPHFVREIREPNPDKSELGSVLKQFEPDVMNKVDIDNNYIDMVQEGLWSAVNTQSGTAYGYFQGTDYEAAGKTGTAQVSVRLENSDSTVDGNNQAFIGYAPYDDPEVTVAVIVPNVYKSSDGGTSGIANTIARRSLDAYFDMKEEREEIEPQGESVDEEE
ncbi:cell division protein FtsI/penicillin-binding protein 2 [Salibacterium salarium]|uniref:peptidoglycan D,D-transpeptidase FtsI family protein n=1 Tax=Salibacterium salarium TaxID=284579 RepID=UPI00277D9821|nr:penicillin-binding transpeptidase domain-containing protein [Salibacterium salarium]MDQ0299709.1 cell division protein FtsI/penicillin-binding protein 2 [Salibacterium salarium]